MSPISLRLAELRHAAIQPKTSEAAVFTSTAFGTSAKLQLSTPLNRLFQPYSTAASTSTTAAIWPDHVPDLPNGTVWILAGGFSFGIVAAICLFLINFYPRRSRSEQVQRKRKREYQEVPQGDIELDSYSTGLTPVTGDDAKPILLRRRGKQKPENLRVDTNAQYVGLGIAVPGGQDDSASTSSSSSTLQAQPNNRAYLQSPYPEGDIDIGHLYRRKKTKQEQREQRERLLANGKRIPHNSDQPTIRLHSPISLRETIHNRTASNSSGHLQSQTPDLEAGGYSGTGSDGRAEQSPPQSPYPSPDPSPANSALCLLLDKGEDAIKYVATKAARIMYQQVKDDPEEGLLLPVRSCEREKIRGDGSMIEVA